MKGYSNYEWFLQNNFKEYSGKWLAILNKKVVDNDDNVTNLILRTKKRYPNEKPLITKVKNHLSIL